MFVTLSLIITGYVILYTNIISTVQGGFKQNIGALGLAFLSVLTRLVYHHNTMLHIIC